MSHFVRTFDYPLIQSIITSDRRIYSAMSDDHCPSMEDFVLPEDPNVWYVLVYEGDRILGFWALIPKDLSTAEVHTCLLPCAWGKTGITAAREMARWIWDNTPFTRLTTSVPAFNRLALRFAKKSGMEEYAAVDNGKYLKNGTLHDLISLELRKPEEI